MSEAIPAFPVTLPNGAFSTGMMLRDYFAAKAMLGLISAGSDGKYGREHIAQWAYEQADAMLIARKEQP